MSTSSSSHTSSSHTDDSASSVDHEPMTFDVFTSLLADCDSDDRNTSYNAYRRLDRIGADLKLKHIIETYTDINTPNEIKKCALDLIYGRELNRIDLEHSTINRFLAAALVDNPDELRMELAEKIAHIGRSIVQKSECTENWSELVEWFDLHATSTTSMHRFSLRILNTYALIFGPESALLVPFIAKSIEHTDASVRSTAFSTLGGVVREWAMDRKMKEHTEKLAEELIPTLVQLAQVDESEGEGTPRWCLSEVASSYRSLRAHLDPLVVLGLQAILDTRMAHREYSLTLLDSLLFHGWRDEIVTGDTLLSLCRDLLTSVKNETKDTIRAQLTGLITTVAEHTIDSTTDEQEWAEVMPFLLESSMSAESRMRVVAIRVLSGATEVFGMSGREEAAILLKRALEDNEKDIRSIAIDAFRSALFNRSIDDYVPLAVTILKMAIVDPSVDEASPRSRLIGIFNDDWSEFSPLLCEAAVVMGDEFMPMFSFLLPLLIHIAKHEHGPACDCSPSKRDEACALITFFVQKFPGAIKPYVHSVWAVVLLHLENTAYEQHREWAADVAPLLLESLKVAGEVDDELGNMLTQYWKAVQKAVNHAKEPRGIERFKIPAYIGSIVRCFEQNEDVSEETLLEMEKFVATELDGAEKRQQEREMKVNKTKKIIKGDWETRCDTKIIEGANSLSRIIRRAKYSTKREAAMANN